MKEIILGTLCWFWDGDEDERVIGQYGGSGAIQVDLDKKTVTHFNIDTEINYNYCRPVKRNEIKLEEDEECANA